MISFRHAGRHYTLNPGDHWSAGAIAPSYRDTAARELWEIVDEIRLGRPWRECVASHFQAKMPWLHRIVTDVSRDLFFREHMPLPDGANVLDVGAGWGQISLPLSRHHTVTALEPTPERLAFIRAAANQEDRGNHLHYIESDFMEVDFETTFDLVCCIGVLEWIPKFRAGPARDLQVDFLRRLQQTLSPAGRVVVGIENRLGLKYLLGARDDHTGLSLVNVLQAPDAAAKHRALTGEDLRVFTYTLPEYRRMFAEAGFQQVSTFAAFPDYKLPQTILPVEQSRSLRDGNEQAVWNPDANQRLGSPLPPDHDGIDGTLLPNQREITSLYHSLAGCGIAPFFAPSYFFILQ
jgi:2-polyprenyl-3-methyl-5-hydroxy-6-metoxy-1,4-benzoquinol methylase